MSSKIDEYLTSGEELLLQWTGGIVPDDSDQNKYEEAESAKRLSGVQFGATSQRILYVDDFGGFKDIDYQHISSVETKAKTDPDPDQYQLLGGIGTAASAFGFGLIFFEAIPGIILTIASLALVGYAMNKKGGFEETFNYDEETTGHEIRFITGDEANMQITIETQDDVGADLSRVIRENST